MFVANFLFSLSVNIYLRTCLIIIMSKRAAKEGEKALSQTQCYYLHNLVFQGPYVSISVLDPIMTIERHHGKYHVATRFNIETTILNYESSMKYNSNLAP
jgi:hypothetical protein